MGNKPNNNKPNNDKPNNNKPNNKPDPSPYLKPARRDVHLQGQSYLDSLNRSMSQANKDYQNQSAGINSIYGGLNDTLAPLYDQYATASAPIATDLQNQLAQFSGMLNAQGLPPTETSAAAGLYGVYGNNGFTNLASQSQRALGYDQSAQREGALSNQYAQQNLSSNLADQLGTYRQQKLDYKAQYPSLISQREDQLQQQDLATQLTNAQIAAMQAQSANDKALQGYYTGAITNLLNPPPTPPPYTPPTTPPPSYTVNPITDTTAGGNTQPRGVVPNGTPNAPQSLQDLLNNPWGYGYG